MSLKSSLFTETEVAKRGKYSLLAADTVKVPQSFEGQLDVKLNFHVPFKWNPPARQTSSISSSNPFQNDS